MKKTLLPLLLALPLSAQAELDSVDTYGFELTIERTVAATQEKAYRQFLNVGQWWNQDHTWFGHSKGLTIDPKAGGCFCEIDGKKQAMHMIVSYVDPNQELRMIGGLGPLQMLGVHGGMSWQFSEVDKGKTKITLNYKVIGRMKEGLDKLAPVVDSVLNVQMNNLAAKF